MDNEKSKALLASSRTSQFGRQLVGRLLTPMELDEVAGGGGSCNGGGDHAMGSGGSFNQTGGSFNQNTGGSYTMNCKYSGMN